MPVTFTDGTTAGVVTIDLTPQLGKKILQVTVPSTFVWGTDSLTIDLTKYGANKLSGVLTYQESTAGSVVVARACTTAVTTGTAVITSTAGNGAKGGTFVIFAY